MYISYIDLSRTVIHIYIKYSFNQWSIFCSKSYFFFVQLLIVQILSSIEKFSFIFVHTAHSFVIDRKAQSFFIQVSIQQLFWSVQLKSNRKNRFFFLGSFGSIFKRPISFQRKFYFMKWNRVYYVNFCGVLLLLTLVKVLHEMCIQLFAWITPTNLITESEI